MPWNAQNFAKKHNHSLSPAQAAKAASVANAVLKKTGDEGRAIAIGNATAQGTIHRSAAGRRLQKGSNG